MRLAAATVLIGQAGTALRAEPPIHLTVMYVLATLAGTLLLAGLWTPISGLLVAVLELWSSFSQPGDPLTKILLGTLGVGLALLGPGAWSADARLFGWKRIDIAGSRDLNTQKSRQKPP